jgi:hypothetical protein
VLLGIPLGRCDCRRLSPVFRGRSIPRQENIDVAIDSYAVFSEMYANAPVGGWFWMTGGHGAVPYPSGATSPRSSSHEATPVTTIPGFNTGLTSSMEREASKCASPNQTHIQSLDKLSVEASADGRSIEALEG